ncbi:hypothetical protein C2G38_2227230 [Gigaspora rosea]|uniref:SPRY domain-containing protein n=1 Tax=Gigaspora rosea TaxID=44941 RepID=A0A397TXM0_9GLOM|nr:hypothetical protein C2G38_2227230 [Gigaspora rosea]
MECDVECDMECDMEYGAEWDLIRTWDIEDKSPFIDIDSSGLKDRKMNHGGGYHGDDGYSFCSGSCEQYDLPRHEYTAVYTTGDIIGCYLNFRSKIVFYTKNGLNLGILYSCVGIRSQDGSIEVNFGNENFKYSAITNEDISKRSKNALTSKYQERDYFIMGEYENMLVNLINELTKSLEKEPSNINNIKN